MEKLKPCPFCGAELEYEEHIAIKVAGHPLLRLWAHPSGSCILAGLEVPQSDEEIIAFKFGWNYAIDEIVENAPTIIPASDEDTNVLCKEEANDG